MMRRKGDSWLISDIYLDGAISEVATRRSEFAAILKSQGIDGLIAAAQPQGGHLDRDYGKGVVACSPGLRPCRQRQEATGAQPADVGKRRGARRGNRCSLGRTVAVADHCSSLV